MEKGRSCSQVEPAAKGRGGPQGGKSRGYSQRAGEPGILVVSLSRLPTAEFSLWEEEQAGLGMCRCPGAPSEEQPGPCWRQRQVTTAGHKQGHSRGAPGAASPPWGDTSTRRQHSAVGRSSSGPGVPPLAQVFLLLDQVFLLLDQGFFLLVQEFPLLAQAFLLLDKVFPLLAQLFLLLDQLFPVLDQLFLILEQLLPSSCIPSPRPGIPAPGPGIPIFLLLAQVFLI